MRNLTLSQIHSESLSSLCPSLETSKIILAQFDEVNNYLIIICNDMKIYIIAYALHEPSELLHEIELEARLSQSTDLLMKIMSEIDANKNPFIFLTFKPEIESLVFSLSSAELITLPISQGDPQISKLSETSLLSMKASPNQEHIVAVFSNFTLLLLMYDDLSVVSKCDLDDGDMSDCKKDPNCTEASISFKQTGDLFAVIYKINNGYKCLVRDTKLTIMKGPGRADNKVVFSVSEAPLDTMCNIVSFQPSGSLIAYYDKKNHQIFFTEKNCLIHGKFDIVYDKTKEVTPMFLKWSYEDQAILFVYESGNEYFIQVYFRSNYQWGLRFELVKQSKVLNAKFSEVSKNQLLLQYENKTFEIIDLAWSYCSSLNYGNNFSSSCGEICVVNNHEIKYTPLALANIPPPMCLVTVPGTKGRKFFWFKNFFFSLYSRGVEVYQSKQREFKLFSSLGFEYKDFNVENAKKVIFVPLYSKNLGFIVINYVNSKAEEELIIVSFKVEYTSDQSKTIEKITELVKVVSHPLADFNCGLVFPSTKFEHSYEDEYFDTASFFKKTITPLDLEKQKKEKKDKNQKMNLDMLQLDHMGQTAEKEDSPLDEDSIYFYYEGYDKTKKEVVFNKISYNSSTHIALIEGHLSFTHPNASEKIIQIQSGITAKNTEIVFYLTHNNKLYQNGKLLSNDINSFVLFKNFLLFTQISTSPYSTLHLIDLALEDIDKFSPAKYVQNLNYKNFNMRTVERGAQIVCCSKINVVLQMPRGNLETISPRLILLHEIRRLVLKEEYSSAFVLCRKHKINLNFIYDVHPDNFISNLKKFVTQVEKPDYINLFINSLSESTTEEYQVAFGQQGKVTPEKRNKICSAIREILTQLNTKAGQYINSILITYTKQTPPMYLDALKLVQKLKIENNEKADKALEFLCWVVKADILFDFALRTYDFELVIMCAKHTQKDPKEYLSYLNSLEEIKKKDPVLMKYQINIDQKAYPEALTELSQGGEKYFEKCIELIRSHNLYDFGLELFKSPLHEELFRKIIDEKGNYYYEKKELSSAAPCFMRSGNYTLAFKCYLGLGKVNQVLTLLTTGVALSKDIETSMYLNLRQLLDTCKVQKATGEIEKIYTFLITGEQWKNFTCDELLDLLEQLIVSTLTNKMYLFSYFSMTNIVRTITEDLENEKYEKIPSEAMKIFMEKLSLFYDLSYNGIVTVTKLFNEKYERLLKVQELKREHPELFVIDIAKGEEEDNVSDSGSVRSKSNKSSMSRMTKKTQMKNKKRSVKEGSIMEEENLIHILQDVKEFEKEISSYDELRELLILCKKFKEAEALKKEQDYLTNYVMKKLPTIFSVDQIKFANEHPELNDLFPELQIHRGITGLKKQPLISKV